MLLQALSWGNPYSSVSTAGNVALCTSVSTCVSRLGLLWSGGWGRAPCAHGLLRGCPLEDESRGTGWARDRGWAKRWPQPDPMGTLDHELYHRAGPTLWCGSPYFVPLSVHHSPPCGGGMGGACCNPQARRSWQWLIHITCALVPPVNSQGTPQTHGIRNSGRGVRNSEGQQTPGWFWFMILFEKHSSSTGLWRRGSSLAPAAGGACKPGKRDQWFLPGLRKALSEERKCRQNLKSEEMLVG